MKNICISIIICALQPLMMLAGFSSADIISELRNKLNEQESIEAEAVEVEPEEIVRDDSKLIEVTYEYEYENGEAEYYYPMEEFPDIPFEADVVYADEDIVLGINEVKLAVKVDKDKDLSYLNEINERSIDLAPDILVKYTALNTTEDTELLEITPEAVNGIQLSDYGNTVGAVMLAPLQLKTGWFKITESPELQEVVFDSLADAKLNFRYSTSGAITGEPKTSDEITFEISTGLDREDCVTELVYDAGSYAHDGVQVYRIKPYNREYLDETKVTYVIDCRDSIYGAHIGPVGFTINDCAAGDGGVGPDGLDVNPGEARLISVNWDDVTDGLGSIESENSQWIRMENEITSVGFVTNIWLVDANGNPLADSASAVIDNNRMSEGVGVFRDKRFLSEGDR